MVWGRHVPTPCKVRNALSGIAATGACAVTLMLERAAWMPSSESRAVHPTSWISSFLSVFFDTLCNSRTLLRISISPASLPPSRQEWPRMLTEWGRMQPAIVRQNLAKLVTTKIFAGDELQHQFISWPLLGQNSWKKSKFPQTMNSYRIQLLASPVLFRNRLLQRKAGEVFRRQDSESMQEARKYSRGQFVFTS